MSLTPPRSRPRELYIDAFRGLMAVVMIQGHVCDSLLSEAVRASGLYRFEVMFHGTTAPGFLFASGFVVGLPRAPLSPWAALRRARRMLFVLGVGYALHLPYASLFKTLAAPPAELREFFACNALQAIAVTQLVVLSVQLLAGRRWVGVALAMLLAIVAVSPVVWAQGYSVRLPAPIGPYFDPGTGSPFPLFPFAAFVLAGAVAGAALGRVDAAVRAKREIVGGLILLALGALLAILLEGKVDFWGASPAYVAVRLGGLLLLLRLVEAAARHGLPLVRPLSLVGHETLLVYVLHLYLLFGGIVGEAPLGRFAGRLGYGPVVGILAAMIPCLYAAAWLWHSAKERAPHEASLAISFCTVASLYEFATRPW